MRDATIWSRSYARRSAREILDSDPSVPTGESAYGAPGVRNAVGEVIERRLRTVDALPDAGDHLISHELDVRRVERRVHDFLGEDRPGGIEFARRRVNADDRPVRRRHDVDLASRARDRAAQNVLRIFQRAPVAHREEKVFNPSRPRGGLPHAAEQVEVGDHQRRRRFPLNDADAVHRVRHRRGIGLRVRRRCGERKCEHKTLHGVTPVGPPILMSSSSVSLMRARSSCDSAARRRRAACR